MSKGVVPVTMGNDQREMWFEATLPIKDGVVDLMKGFKYDVRTVHNYRRTVLSPYQYLLCCTKPDGTKLALLTQFDRGVIFGIVFSVHQIVRGDDETIV